MVYRHNLEALSASSAFGSLSERAFNALSISRLDNVPGFLTYYKKFGNFLQLRHCGAKTNQELIALASALIEKTAEQDHRPVQNEKVRFSASDTFQSELCDSALKTYHTMPMRPKNVLHLNGITGPDAFLKYYREHKNFGTLRHCGAVTNQTLISCAKEMMKEQQDSLTLTGS
ncbi:MAG: hypothetical protein LAT75_09240 [Candidatus Cyclonatronum sp.]|uniref:hypothetical protein n=1 Tax=Cyclonatronum sp. TaxID=3024185 RepID=UPI0025BFF805|nr:hypothetical protein [Cyclonatronum sp.]MCC5934201.1 hypothetical protein [Balneolales bacterium]MCH8487040.1 hypothetical protein [Cyclonatronum sp.]